jgi:hypothetical protein
MKRTFHAASFLSVVMFLLSNAFAQIPVTSKHISAQGIIVAFQKDSRHRVMPYTGGIATPVEFLIVRIDQWPDNAESLSNQKYILVTYRLYERNLTDCDINAKKLLLTFRQKREDEHTDCLGEPPKNSSDGYISKYERTIPGKDAEIPPLSKLPCLIAEHAPVVVE